MPNSLPPRILIVEDQKEKTRAISECLIEALPGCEIATTETVLVASHMINIDRNWSGIVLDLAFPQSQETGSRRVVPYLAGLRILQSLNEMRADCPVIVATQHQSFVGTEYGTFNSIQELRTALKKAFPRNFKEIIEVNFGTNKWRELLVTATEEHFK